MNENGSPPIQTEQAVVHQTCVMCPKCRAWVERALNECPQCHTLLFHHVPLRANRMERIQEYSLGQMLLREREYLFESIYREDGLEHKMRYYLQWACLFSALYGAFLGTFAGYGH